MNRLDATFQLIDDAVRDKNQRSKNKKSASHHYLWCLKPGHPDARSYLVAVLINCQVSTEAPDLLVGTVRAFFPDISLGESEGFEIRSRLCRLRWLPAATGAFVFYLFFICFLFVFYLFFIVVGIRFLCGQIRNWLLQDFRQGGQKFWCEALFLFFDLSFLP